MSFCKEDLDKKLHSSQEYSYMAYNQIFRRLIILLFSLLFHSQFPGLTDFLIHEWKCGVLSNSPSYPCLTLSYCISVTCTYIPLMESHFMSCPSLYRKTGDFLPVIMMIFAAYVKMEGIFCVVMDAQGLFT